MGGAASQGSTWCIKGEEDSAVGHAEDVAASFLNVDAELGQGVLSAGLISGDARLGGGGRDAFLHIDKMSCGDGGSRGLEGGSVLDAGERGRDLARSSGDDRGHLQNGYAQGAHACSSQEPPSCTQEDEWFAYQAELLRNANEHAKRQLCQSR